MFETAAAPPPADPPQLPADTFCAYLARQFSARYGFIVGTVPEAERLVAASDVVLTLQHGVPFTILCLIDREAHPGKTFDLTVPKLQDIAEQCSQYSAKVSSLGSKRMPVVIRVIEIGPASPERWEQLRTIVSPFFGTKCRISALAVDTASRTVQSNSRRDKPERPFIQEMLNAPRQSDAEITPFVGVELPPKSTPMVTLSLIAALCLIFLAEIVFSVDPAPQLFEPSLRTEIALGGLQYLLTVEQGQWWRVFTGPLLHGNFVHILLNCIALLLAGTVLERAVGRLWFAAFFVIGALGGACGSLLANPHNVVSVGASGAIMGLFAAVLVIAFRYTNGQDRLTMQRRAIQILIPSLLPLASASKTATVDYGAHIGGAVAGAIAAFVLSHSWRTSEVLPGFRKGAMAVIAFGTLGTLAGGVAIPLKFHFWTAVAQMIPSERLPKKDADINENSARILLEKYPNDPRSHFYNAVVLIRKNDLQGGERELRATLAEEFAMKQVLTPSFNAYVQGMLALVLSDEKRTDEARQAAAGVCENKSSSIVEKLQAAGLCTNPPQ